MALAPLLLDDVTWEALVLAARGNIAAASRNQWTNHSPVDPGVTLTELYAWLFEQRIFWLDQVDEPLLRALLKILGGSVAEASCARTVVAARVPDSGAVAAVLPKRTKLVHGAEGERLFTTSAAAWFAPIERVGLVAQGVDRSADLARGRTIALLAGAEDPEAEALASCPGCTPEATAAVERAFTIRFNTQGFGNATAPFGILLELDVSDTIAPDWAPALPGIAEVAPAAELELWYRTAAGPQRVPGPVVDGTHGLRRSGILSFLPPGDWKEEPGSAPGSIPWYELTVRVGTGELTSPPRLRALSVNAVVASHRARVCLGGQQIDWLPLPHRSASLGVAAPLPSTVKVKLRYKQRWTTWSRTPDLTFHGPEERVFEVDRSAARVRFGDGLMGRIPRIDSQVPNFRGYCDVGGGKGGNLARGNPWRAEGYEHLEVENVVAAEWGGEEETAAAALQRRAGELKRRERAITATEHEEVVRATPRVAIARAYAAVGWHPAHSCARPGAPSLYVPSAVTVFVVPHAPRDTEGSTADSAFVAAPRIDAPALAAARSHVDRWRLVGSEVFVEQATYRQISLAVSLRGDPRDERDLARRIRAKLRAFLDPLVGGDKGEGWPFGAALRPSALAKVAQLVAGNEAEVETVAISLDGQPAESCAETIIAPHELVVAGRITVRLTRAARKGGLK